MKLTPEAIAKSFIGKTARADHPSQKDFKISGAKFEDGKFSVRGENTCWFRDGIVEIVD